MEYNDTYGGYIFETDAVIFLWEQDLSEVQIADAYQMEKSYLDNLNYIADEIFKEVKDIWEVESAEEVKSKLGRPVIEPERGVATYCDHQLDDTHIISFEFEGSSFDKIFYVAIDG